MAWRAYMQGGTAAAMAAASYCSITRHRVHAHCDRNSMLGFDCRRTDDVYYLGASEGKSQIKYLSIYDKPSDKCSCEDEPKYSLARRSGIYCKEKLKEAELGLKCSMLNCMEGRKQPVSLQQVEELWIPPERDWKKLAFIACTAIAGAVVGSRGCPTRFRRFSCTLFGFIAGVCLAYPVHTVALTRCYCNKLVGAKSKRSCGAPCSEE